MTAYVFGDNEIAVQRLRLLAKIYDASTRAFVRVWAQPHRRDVKVVDLGCALGYTTRLLAEELQGEQTVGLDNSESYIALAQRESGTIEGLVRIRQGFGLPLTPGDARIQPDRHHEHTGVGIQSGDHAVRADASGRRPGQYAGTTGDIQHPFARLDSGGGDQPRCPLLK
jgi:SAM-dependent methyltransferase